MSTRIRAMEVRALRATRERVAQLLSRYPGISEHDVPEIVEFLRTGRHLDIGLLTADDELRPKLDAFMDEHGSACRVGFGQISAVSSWWPHSSSSAGCSGRGAAQVPAPGGNRRGVLGIQLHDPADSLFKGEQYARRLFAMAVGLSASVAVFAAEAATDGPSDPQIAHIAYTAGQLDVAAAKLALAKSKNPAVRDFARPWFAIMRR